MGSRDLETILPLTMDRNRWHSRKNRDASTWKTAVLVVCLCALMCVGVVVYVHLAVNSVSDRISRTDDEVASLRQVLPSRQIPQWLNKTLETRNKYKRNARKSKGSQTEKYPPFIHLFGKINGRDHTEKDYIYFTWDKEELNIGNFGFELVGDKNLGYYKVIVKHTGVYLIYAQVAVNGRDEIHKPYECSHDTVCTRGSKRIVLLSSLVTQYQLGRRYEENENNEGLRALDTMVHMGVFMLLKGDVLSVQYPESCHNMEYSMTPQHSYFGLAKLTGHKEKVEKQPGIEQTATRIPPKLKKPRK